MEKSFSFRARGTPVICGTSHKRGGLEIRALSSSLRQLPAHVLFVGLEKGLRRAILEKSFSFRARGTPVIGLRSEP